MKTILKRIISDFHQTALPGLRPRTLDIPLDLEKIVTLIGPRRAGKTFYLYQLIGHLEKTGVRRQEILYLNFEDERIDLEGNNDLILDAYRELYPDQDLSRVYLFFDEIQELPGWEKFVRRVSDGISRHIFLTGSNSRLLSKEIASSLRGRSISFEILPLSFPEYLTFLDLPAKVPNSSRDRAMVQNAFEQYSLWGGFPELVKIDPRFKVQVLQEYFHVMLYRDLVEHYQIRDAAVLKYLVKRLIGSFTKEFSINKLYNDIKSKGFSIGKDSLYRMTEGIFAIYMLASIERYDPSVVRREMSNKKVYLFDNGFASALNYAFAEDRGKLLENMVFRHLRGKTPDVFFIRNGWECDFIVFSSASKIQCFQVALRLGKDNLEREVKGLISAKNYLGHAEGFLLAEEIEPGLNLPDWIQVLPVHQWLLGMGDG